MSETPVLYKPETNREALSLVEQAKILKITDKKSFDMAGELSLSLAREIKELESKWNPLVEKATASLREIKDSKDFEINPRKEVYHIISSLRVDYKIEQDRRAKFEQEWLEREAKQKAEKERQKLLDKAMQAKTPKKQAELLEKAEQVYTKPVFAESATPKTMKFESGGSITFINDTEVSVSSVKLVCKAIFNGIIPETCVEFKNLKQWVKLNNITAFEGLCIKEIQREMKRV